MRLETDRLVLRELRSSDLADVHRYASDPVVTEHEPWGPNDDAASRAFLVASGVEAFADPRTHWTFAIVPKPGDRLVGACSVWIESAENQVGAIGYVLCPSAWGQGYATEASRALLAYGFGELGLHRMSAITRPENARSWQVLERLGMKREGHLREDTRIRGVWRDTLVYAILADG